MDQVKITKDLENKTLIIERTFNAPIEKLWRAYADKEWFEKWWGPEGWETTTKEHSLTPGGRIHYGMKCVDKDQGEWFGKESWGLMEITAVDEPNSLAATDYFSNAEGTIDESMPPSLFTIQLIEENGKTRMINRSSYDTVEQLEQLVQMGMAEGYTSQLNKLNQLLAQEG